MKSPAADQPRYPLPDPLKYLRKYFSFCWEIVSIRTTGISITRETGLAAASMEPPSYHRPCRREDRKDHNRDQARHCGIFNTAGNNTADVCRLSVFKLLSRCGSNGPYLISDPDYHRKLRQTQYSLPSSSHSRPA